MTMPATPKHGVRIPDDLWEAAQEEAVRRGESVTAAINRFLGEYANHQSTPKASAQTIAAIARRKAS
jgi:hypothetical protein